MNRWLARLAALVVLLAVPAAAQVDVATREGRRAVVWNLAEVAGWSTGLPFIDVMRNGSRWIGHLPGQWGGMDEAALFAAGALDADGWVVQVPRTVRRISTSILVDLPAGMTSAAGRWHARWEGSAYLGFSGAARGVRYRDNSASFDFQPGQGAVIVEFNRGTLRNLTIVHERHLDLFEAGAVFNPEWLARIGDAAGFRFMDWMLTNGSDVARWDERAQVSDYSWSRRGVPLEIMLQLANETGADPWFTLPHLADDDYARQFAQTVRDGLRRDLRAWFEFSNELWNWSFPQADWATQLAAARWGDGGSGWVQAASVRAAEIMAIIDSVYAGQETRRIRVLGLFTGWLGLEQDMLDAPLYTAENPAHRPPHEHFDALAVTGYFSGDLHEEARLPMVRGWLEASRADAAERADAQGLAGETRAAWIAEHRFDLALDLAAHEVLDGAISGDPENSLRDVLDRTLAHHARVAADRGMALVMYEGGTHVVARPEDHGDSELIAFFTALNYSAQMGDLYRALVEGWQDLSAAPFGAYMDIGRPGPWGSWGALRHLDDDTPRWRALIEATQP